MDRAYFDFLSAILRRQFNHSAPDARVFSRRVRNLFFLIAQITKPTVSVEVGAFEASFTRWVEEKLPNTAAYALEANPAVYDKYSPEFETLRATYMHACAALEVGVLPFNVPRDFRGRDISEVNQMSSLMANTQTVESDTVDVKALPVDDITRHHLDDASGRSLCWIDVEGACSVVLPGMRKTLERAVAVWIEVESRPKWDGQWLDGDVAEFAMECGLVPLIRDLQRPHQFNWLFVAPDVLANPIVQRRAHKLFQSAFAGVELDS